MTFILYATAELMTTVNQISFGVFLCIFRDLGYNNISTLYSKSFDMTPNLEEL